MDNELLKARAEAATRNQSTEPQRSAVYQRKQVAGSKVLHLERPPRLQAQDSATSKVNSSRVLEELAQDEEYRELLEKYGDRLRVPPLPMEYASSTSFASRSGPRKPPIPSSSNKRPACDVSSSCSPRNSKWVLPEVTPEELAGENNVIRRSAQARTARFGSIIHKELSGGLGGLDKIMQQHSQQQQLPDPNQSLMPRKELLRKKQEALLRKTDVTFYRQHMRKHFDKILEAVEVTFQDKGRQQKRSAWNLAKPITESP